MNEQIKVFLSYSHKDKVLKDAFVAQLYSLVRTENITLWTDSEIDGGERWDDKINTGLDTADLVLLLISPDFIKSEYCYHIELKRAIELHVQRKAVVVPIGLRFTDITGHPFSQFQMLPVNPLFVEGWTNQNEAFVNVIQGLRKTLAGIVTEMKNWNPIKRKEEIRRLVEVRKYEDACNKLIDFVCDFSGNETLKDKVSIIKAECTEILEDKGMVDYLKYREALKKLLVDIFDVLALVLGELNKAA
jgi:TIR domain